MVPILLILGFAAKDRWWRPMDNQLKSGYKAKLCKKLHKNDPDEGMGESVNTKRIEKADATGGV